MRLRAEGPGDPAGLDRRTILTSLAGTVMAMTSTSETRAAAASVDAGMMRAAQSWLESLAPELRAHAIVGFEPSAHADWHYVPRRRAGLPLREMTADQRQLLWALMHVALSDRGLRKSKGVIELEGILGELTSNPSFRDPDNYALVIIGTPSEEKPWAWRFEGHHLSLTFTIVPGLGVAATPSFFGSNPAIVPQNHTHAGHELLARERELGFALLRELPDGLRNQATIDSRSLGDIVAGPGRETSLKAFEGVPLRRLVESQRAVAMQLVEVFVDHLRPDLAERELDRIREGGTDGIHFAWAGSHEPGSPHYFRLHGPTLIIEYDNTQNGANHVHTVWHDPTNVFGTDLLRDHYADRRHG